MRPKYYVVDRIFGCDREQTQLFPDLFAAIRGCFWSKSAIVPVPTAWGDSPLKRYTPGYAWLVQSHSVHEDGEVFQFTVAGFNDPLDAFFFAEAKEKQDNWGKRPTKWFVLLYWQDESGRFRQLERLQANWLTEKQRAEERARKRKQRLAA